MTKKEIKKYEFLFVILSFITISILLLSNTNNKDKETEKYENKIWLVGIEKAFADDILNPNETIDMPQQFNISAIINNKKLNIINYSSFIDTLGYLHIIGKVKNNTTKIAEFVSVKGTFYDNDNKVIGTSFNYTEPRSLNSSEIASFDLVLQNASISITQIEKYTLRPVWD